MAVHFFKPSKGSATKVKSPGTSFKGVKMAKSMKAPKALKMAKPKMPKAPKAVKIKV